MECKKCKSLGDIILRGKDNYCASCFLINTNHKFRACIGKNKILSKNEKVLVCLSGGAGSSVLLDLIDNGLAMDSHKKLRITPFFLHIMELNEEANQVESIIQQCKRYNCGVYIIHISDYMVADSELTDFDRVPRVSEDKERKLLAFLKSMPSTVRNDQLLKIKRDLFIRIAKQLECNFTFTAETTTTLAMNLLTNLSLGRGSQVENNVGFCDLRNEDTKLLRPMKDISAEEIEHYIRLKDLSPILTSNDIKDNSLQSVIKGFVTNLQESFSATISTVCKTADKLGVQESCERREKCSVCESVLSVPNNKLTAFEATNFSRLVSDGQLTEQIEKCSEFDSLGVNKSLFPFFNEKLCYGCSRNLSESDQSLLPGYLRQMLVED